MGIAADLTLVVLAGVLGGLAARLVRQPLILGYLVAGVLLGPRLTNTISDAANLELLAEIGVTLLLFGLGLELSLREMAPVRRVALAGTALQMLICTALGTALGRALGLAWVAAVWFGALVSLSSTIVVIKTLQAQGRIGTLSSRVMLGMLVAQDLAVVPLMIVLPQLASPEANVGGILWSAGKAALLLAAIATIGARAFPWIVERVARGGSRELFLLVVTGTALGVGSLTHAFGLSAALGAFVAGLVLSESEYSHQALSDIIPLRDVFSLLFFASVGTLLDPSQLIAHLPLVLLTIGLVGAGKGLVFAGITRAFGYRNVIPLASGLALFQVGEFSFVLARVGLASQAISGEVYALVLNTALVTMALTPVVSGLTPALYGWLGRRREREPVQTINLPRVEMHDHVVIAGAGRVGSSVASALARRGLPFVLIELDSRRLDHARAEGWPIVFGDAAQPPVLEAAHVAGASLLLVTAPAYPVARGIVDRVRQLNPAIAIVARAEGFEALAALREAGVEEAIQPELEAGLEMTRQSLLHLRVPPSDILQLTERLRRERYGEMPPTDPGERDTMNRLAGAMRLLDFKWIPIAERSPLAGRTIGEVGIRSRTGASIVGLSAGEQFLANPGPDRALAAGSLIAVVGGRDQIDAVERLAAAPDDGHPSA
jgi:CPA2 family monovalent cation:H+ antiporter-2